MSGRGGCDHLVCISNNDTATIERISFNSVTFLSAQMASSFTDHPTMWFSALGMNKGFSHLNILKELYRSDPVSTAAVFCSQSCIFQCKTVKVLWQAHFVDLVLIAVLVSSSAIEVAGSWKAWTLGSPRLKSWYHPTAVCLLSLNKFFLSRFMLLIYDCWLFVSGKELLFSATWCLLTANRGDRSDQINNKLKWWLVTNSPTC